MLDMPGPAPIDPSIRYHSKVDKRGPGDCWEWNAARFDKGYGAFRLGTKQLKAHRFGYTLLVGPIPDGLYVCHTCDNPPCQNPAHWFLGTHRDNAADRERKQRGNHIAGETCPGARLSELQIGQIRELYAAGRTQQSLADEFGTVQSNVSHIVRGRRRSSEAGTVTEQNRHIKLTAESVRKIRRLYCQDGRTQEHLSKMFGVTQRCISQVVLRQTWQHVD